MVVTTELQIFRGTEVLAVVPIDDKTEYIENFMADCGVAFEFTLPSPLDIQLDDYIIFEAEEFFIAELPSFVKSSEENYRYKGRFESPLHALSFELMMHLGDVEFSFTGSAGDHLQLLIDIINDAGLGWSVGEIDITESKTITYNATTCRDALDLIAKEFKLEFKAKEKTIDLVAHVGTIIDLPVGYGRGKGLYSLTRLAVDKSKIFNRVRAYGGIKNIDHNYRDGAQKLVFEERYLDAETPYRRRTCVYENPDIFPRRTGTITAFTNLDESTQLFTITDPTLDFNIKDCILEGLPAKVLFKTGELTSENGFEIHDYDHVTKTITLKAHKEGNDTLPNATFSAAVGNTYTLVDLKMPNSYVVAAELELKTKAQEYLDIVKLAQVVYDLNAIDENFILKNGVKVTVADKLPVVDEALEIDHLLRITGLRYPPVKPWAIKAMIANFLYRTPVGKTDDLVEAHDKEIKRNATINALLARNNTKNLNTLQNRLFDPDGNLADGALSILAAMGKFGFDSQNFDLIKTKILTDVGGNPNSFQISSGTLRHRVFKIENGGYQWAMTARSWTGLNPTKYYYVYAKCSKNTLFGTWEISETEVKTNSIENYWCFNMGQLFEVNADGFRDFEFTKGVTYFVGGQIYTGRIQDVTKQNYIDLDQSQVNFGNASSKLDYNVTRAGRISTIGGIHASRGGAVDYPSVYVGLWNAGVPYYLGDLVKYTDGNYYKWINPAIEGATGLVPPANLMYWRKSTEQGADGADGVDGAAGASLIGRGIWENTKIYVGSPTRVEVVRYGSDWYMTKKTVGTIPVGTLPTNTTYFEPFVGQFENIATKVAYIDYGVIENAEIRNLKTSATGKRVEIDADNNNIRIYSSTGALLVAIDDDTGFGGEAGITVNSASGYAQISGRGVAVGETELRRDRLFLAGELFMYVNPITGQLPVIKIYDGTTTHTGFTGYKGTIRFVNGICV